MKRIAELFERARELDAAARPALLARECHDDEGLRKAVEQLLSASAEAENCPIWQASAMDSEARMLAAESYGPANRLQRYQLLELLGAGGMGMVYAAVRADDSYDKKVAIKVVQRGMGDEAIVRQFRQERQILAGLEHPNIARLLDGGSTTDGLPFLVMEFVDGVPIDRYLERTRPGVAGTLRLFRNIAGAFLTPIVVSWCTAT